MSVELEIVIEDVALGVPGAFSSTTDSRAPIEVAIDTVSFSYGTVASSVELLIEEEVLGVLASETLVSGGSSVIEILAENATISSGSLIAYSGTVVIENDQDRPLEVYIQDTSFSKEISASGYEVIVQDIVFDSIVIGETIEVGVFPGLASTNANEIFYNNSGTGGVINPGSDNIQLALSDVQNNALGKTEAASTYINKTEDMLSYLDAEDTRDHLSVYSRTEVDANTLSKSLNLVDVPNKPQALLNLGAASKTYVDDTFITKGNNLSDIADKAAALATLGGISQTTADNRYMRGSSNLNDLASPSTSRTNLGVYSKAEVDFLIEQGTGDGTVLEQGTGILITDELSGAKKISANLLGFELLNNPGVSKIPFFDYSISKYAYLNLAASLSISSGVLGIISAPKWSLARSITVTGDATGSVSIDGSSDVTLTLSIPGAGPHTHPISEVVGLQDALDSKAALIHGHAISDVTGLSVALDSKANVSHTHSIAEVTGLQTELNTKATTTYVDTALAGKANVSHTHAISDVTGLQTALDNKASINHQHAILDVAGLETSLANKQALLVSGTNIKTINGQSILGTGDLVIEGGSTSLPINISDVTGLQTALDGKAPTSHTHNISQVTNLQLVLNSKASIVHSHNLSDVIGLQTALDAKANVSHVHGMADIYDLQSAMNDKADLTYVNIELSDKADANHVHSISDVTGLQTALDGKASTAVVTTTVNGLMSFSDKVKLDGIATNANNYVHPTSDGYLHVPATGTTNTGKFLRAGGFEGAMSWASLAISDIAGLSTTLSGKADSIHEHAISQVQGLQAALDGKAASSHAHSISEVTGLQTALDGKASTAAATTSTNGLMSFSDKIKLDGIAAGANNYVHPTSDGYLHVPPTGTTNNGRVLKAGSTAGSISWSTLAISDISGLQAALDGKAASSHAHSISEVTGLQTALDGKAASSHTHTIANVTGLQTALDGKASTALATTSTNGLMSSSDKTKLDNLGTSVWSGSATGQVTVSLVDGMYAIRARRYNGDITSYFMVISSGYGLTTLSGPSGAASSSSTAYMCMRYFSGVLYNDGGSTYVIFQIIRIV